jgi:hypothetical protein
VILSESNGELSPSDRANLGHLRGELDALLLGEITARSVATNTAHECIDLDRLLALV